MKNIVLITLLLLSLTGCKNDPDKHSIDQVPEYAPEGEVKKALQVARSPLAVYDFEGLDSAFLQSRNDTTYVVNFWATWCKPCVKELPYFEKLGDIYSDKKVKVVLVSLDFPEHIDSKVLPFLAKHRLKSEVVLLDDTDANTWIPKVDPDWQGSIPATLIFNRSNKQFIEKQLTFEELEQKVKSIL